MTVDCSDRDERVLPQTFVDYESPAREYMLTAVNTVVDVHTRVSDLYSVPYNQISEQLRLTIEIVKERQESELINNANMACCITRPRSAHQDPQRRARRRTIWTSCWRRYGRSRDSSWRIRRPSRHLDASVHGAAFLRPPCLCSARNSSPGAAIPLIPSDKIADRRRQVEYSFGSQRGAQTRRGWAVPAESAGTADAGPVGALHGHQSQGHRFVLGLAVLLARGSHGRCAGVLEGVETDKYHEYKWA